MNDWRAVFCAVGICAALPMFSGCGAPQMPSVSRVLPPQNAILDVHPDQGPSWMARDATTNTLLYVSDVGTYDVYVYAYPGGTRQGKLTGFKRPLGVCADKSGDVFVTNLDTSEILEYAHGGTKPIAVLKDPGEEPGGCAVDPTTGNLAVTNLSTPYSNPGDVAIYARAQGTPRQYRDAAINYYDFCGYDNQGNLYVDGMKSGAFQFAELPKGKVLFTNIKLNEHFSYGGAVQWDGNDIAVGDYESQTIYRFHISGATGTEVGATHLDGSNFPIGFWIEGSTVIGPNDDGANIMFWKYPQGGSHTKRIGGLRNPWGATISAAP
jgi:hypothetical protein